jgi:hypothetical protein
MPPLSQVVQVSAARPVSSIDDAAEARAQLQNKDLAQDIRLKRLVATFALGGLGVQLLIADGVFAWYGFDSSWHVPVSAIQVWLAATVVQIVGVLTVIARYLFPARQPNRSRPPS